VMAFRHSEARGTGFRQAILTLVLAGYAIVTSHLNSALKVLPLLQPGEPF
jgi:hypothetical protein